MTAKNGWQREFDEPIAAPVGRVLRNLRDAGDYITMLLKGRPLSRGMAGRDGSTYPGGRLGWPNDVRADRNHAGAESNRERVFNPERKDHHWNMRKLKRDGWRQ